MKKITITAELDDETYAQFKSGLKSGLIGKKWLMVEATYNMLKRISHNIDISDEEIKLRTQYYKELEKIKKRLLKTKK